MKVFKFYVGTKAGGCAKNTQWEGRTFSKAEVVHAIEHNRQSYNILYGNTMPIQGYSLYSIDGYWEGVQETSYVLEVMIDSMDYEALASGLKAELHQDSVMVTVQDLEVKFL
ncbi:MAG: hypothetical protein WCS17_14005 [Prevotella sp.]